MMYCFPETLYVMICNDWKARDRSGEGGHEGGVGGGVEGEMGMGVNV